jgi:hypothetical protein
MRHSKRADYVTDKAARTFSKDKQVLVALQPVDSKWAQGRGYTVMAYGFFGRQQRPEFVQGYASHDDAYKCEALRNWWERATKRAEQRKQEQEARRQARTATSQDLFVGDVLVQTFGYDARLVTFYQIVRRTAKYVTLRKLNANLVGENSQLYGVELVPAIDSFADDEEKRCKIQCWNGKETGAKIDRYHASKWDGKPESHYNNH